MNIRLIQQKCVKYISKNGLESFDLYDAMTNPLLDRITNGKPLLRRLIIQFNARSPINFRCFGMKKMEHTKSITDMLWYYSIADVNDKKAKIDHYFNKLLEVKNKNEYSWGLNFPFTSRFGSSSSDTPNLYNTVHAGLAICHAFPFLDAREKITATQMINGIYDFINNKLGFVDEEHKGWYLYYPSQKTPTYNVNALALYLLVKSKGLIIQNDVESRINKILNLLIEEQNEDGSWYYSRTKSGEWIDGFHSAFIIESLSYLINSGYNVKDLTDSANKAVKFYLENMFTKDFFPIYYYKGGKYPIESQNSAQAIQTLACLGLWIKSDNYEILNKVIENVLGNLYDEEGFIYHKKNKLFTYKTSYLRWSTTPMILALEYAQQYLNKDRLRVSSNMFQSNESK